MLRGARGVIVRNEKVLLGKRLKRASFDGLWCTFGGAVELRETLEQVLKRELSEELGIDITEREFLTVTQTVAEDDLGGIMQLHYLVR